MTVRDKGLGEMVVRASDDVLGELLRDVIFTGEGYGCYSTFDVRDDAREWSEAERREFWAAIYNRDIAYEADELPQLIEEATAMGKGYTWPLGDLAVECCWYWDGDGTLCFRVLDGEDVLRFISNDDCKKDYGWGPL